MTPNGGSVFLLSSSAKINRGAHHRRLWKILPGFGRAPRRWLPASRSDSSAVHCSAIFKALTAVKLADQATRAGVDCVPVFWLATEDHDLAEVNQVSIPGSDGFLQKLTAPTEGVPDAPVGTVRFGAEIQAVGGSGRGVVGSLPKFPTFFGKPTGRGRPSAVPLPVCLRGYLRIGA